MRKPMERGRFLFPIDAATRDHAGVYANGCVPRKARERWPGASGKAKKKGDHVLNATSREVTPRETQLSRDFYGEVAAAPAKRSTRLFQLREFLVHAAHRVNNSTISSYSFFSSSPFSPFFLARSDASSRREKKDREEEEEAQKN